jgi:ABC-type branched-subunit amino acid transport system ATPase component
MTVLENVLTAMDRNFRAGTLRMALRTPEVRREEQTGHDQALEYLEFVGLVDHADELARNLAYGNQRRLEIARALATQPNAAGDGNLRPHRRARLRSEDCRRDS